MLLLPLFGGCWRAHVNEIRKYLSCISAVDLCVRLCCLYVYVCNTLNTKCSQTTDIFYDGAISLIPRNLSPSVHDVCMFVCVWMYACLFSAFFIYFNHSRSHSHLCANCQIYLELWSILMIFTQNWTEHSTHSTHKTKIAANLNWNKFDTIVAVPMCVSECLYERWRTSGWWGGRLAYD